MITNAFETPEDAIQHFVVKGMKLGVRNASDSSTSSNIRRTANSEAVSAARNRATANSRSSDSSSSKLSRRGARKELRDLGKNARAIVRESNTTTNKRDRARLAKEYERDVYNRVNDPKFKETFKKANSMTKGDMAVHVLLLGPLAAVSIPATMYVNKQVVDSGLEAEHDATASVLRQLRQL